MTRRQRTWRDHCPPNVELQGSELELTVGEEFARARARHWATLSALRRSKRQRAQYETRKSKR